MNAQPVKSCRYWSRDPDGRLRCDLCPRACRLRDGQRGACVVRRRAGSELVLDSYGLSSGFCVDPIEKKPLYHFLPGSSVLSFGGIGCNLACRFCQNSHISMTRDLGRLNVRAAPDDIAGAARESGCSSVAFTYNEPIVSLEYVVDVAAACRAAGLRTVAVTNGYVCSGARKEFLQSMDAANIDLKAFSEAFYRRQCAGRLGAVLETIECAAASSDLWLEVTCLLIEGENDNPDDLGRMTEWLVEHAGHDTPVHFTAFHPAGRMLDRVRTSSGTLARARAIGLAGGLRHVYTGNVVDPQGARTRCAECDALLIDRRDFSATPNGLTATGGCRACGVRLSGVF